MSGITGDSESCRPLCHCRRVATTFDVGISCCLSPLALGLLAIPFTRHRPEIPKDHSAAGAHPSPRYWLRRLWPLYCFLTIAATFGYALYEPYQIDGDAVAYMDIGDLLRAHNWHAVINGYWNPLYPASLASAIPSFTPPATTSSTPITW